MPESTTARSPSRTGFQVQLGIALPRHPAGAPRTARCGVSRWPPLATAAIITAICSGVASSGPWPIATEIVSPGYHWRLRTRWLQAPSGTSPAFSPGRSMPVRAPKPKARA